MPVLESGLTNLLRAANPLLGKIKLPNKNIAISLVLTAVFPFHLSSVPWSSAGSS